MMSLMAAMALVATATAAAPTDVTLVFAEFPWGLPDEPFRPTGFYVDHDISSVPPAGVTFPKTTCNEPLYDVFLFGAAKWHVMLDKSSPGEAFYNRFYVDTDCDNDLAGEKPLEAKVEQGGGYFHASAYAKLNVSEKDGQSRPYTISLYLSYRAPGLFESAMRYLSGQPAKPTLVVQSQCAYFGMLNFNGADYRLWLNDSNFDGRFTDDTVPAGDHLFIERNEPVSGLPRDSLTELTLELADVPLAPRIGIGDTLFDVTLDLNASKLTFAPVPESSDAAKLQLPPDVATLSLQGRQPLAWYHPAPAIGVPPGSYQVASYRIVRHDPQGDLWRISYPDTSSDDSQAKGGAWRNLQLAAGDVKPLAFGEPVRAAVKMEDSISGFFSNTASFTFETRGVSGELITISHEGERTKFPLSQNNRERPAEPAVKAVKADGEVVWQGVFRYG